MTEDRFHVCRKNSEQICGKCTSHWSTENGKRRNASDLESCAAVVAKTTGPLASRNWREPAESDDGSHGGHARIDFSPHFLCCDVAAVGALGTAYTWLLPHRRSFPR